MPRAVFGTEIYGFIEAIADGMGFAESTSCSQSIYNANKKERNDMPGWTLTFLIIALVAGVLGFIAVAGTAIGIAKVIFAIFLTLFLVSLIIRLAAK